MATKNVYGPVYETHCTTLGGIFDGGVASTPLGLSRVNGSIKYGTLLILIFTNSATFSNFAIFNPHEIYFDRKIAKLYPLSKNDDCNIYIYMFRYKFSPQNNCIKFHQNCLKTFL